MSARRWWEYHKAVANPVRRRLPGVAFDGQLGFHASTMNPICTQLLTAWAIMGANREPVR